MRLFKIKALFKAGALKRFLIKPLYVKNTRFNCETSTPIHINSLIRAIRLLSLRGDFQLRTKSHRQTGRQRDDRALLYHHSGAQVAVTLTPTYCLQLYDAIGVCIASGRGTQLVSVARTLTQPQHWGRYQSQRIGLYAHLGDTAQTQGTMKCQWMARRKTGGSPENGAALSHRTRTHIYTYTDCEIFKMTICSPPHPYDLCSTKHLYTREHTNDTKGLKHACQASRRR